MRDKQFKFAAIPARVMLDDRLTARHWRVFAVIGPFDQMSGVKGGTCCTAANRKIAAAAGLTEQECSRMISDLVKWGYLERVPGARGNRPGLRIVYDLAADEAAFTMIVTGQNLVRIDKNTLSAATTNTPESLSEAPQKPQSAQSVIVPKDTSEEKDNLERKDNPEGERYSDESARNAKTGIPESSEQLQSDIKAIAERGAQLAIYERAWKARPEMIARDFEVWEGWLSNVEDAETDVDHNSAQRAGRLLNELYLADHTSWNPSNTYPDTQIPPLQFKLLRSQIRDHLQRTGTYARAIVQHPACQAAGLTDPMLSRIRNGRVSTVRRELADAIITAISN